MRLFYPSNIVLCYHSISDQPAQNLHRVYIRNFESHIKWLIKKKYAILGIDEYMSISNITKNKIAAITFDDAYSDVMLNAIPILEYYKLPFTIYVNPSNWNGQMLWRDKIRWIIENEWIEKFKLSIQYSSLHSKIDWKFFYKSTKSDGINSKELDKLLDIFLEENSLPAPKIYIQEKEMENLPNQLATIGNHSFQHYRLSSLSPEEQYFEINESKIKLNHLLLRLTNIFAIPFGEYKSFNQSTIDVLNELGYKGFLMTNQNQNNKAVQLKLDPKRLTFSNRLLPKNSDVIF
jgi:peptidoglycan/xylan/chitin deacetylase (PgdA/CDA1 family)